MTVEPSLAGTAALVIWGDVGSSDHDQVALNEWWTNEHLPERMSITGFLRARRFSVRDHSANITHYLTLYEAAELATLTSPEYMEKLNNPTPGTQHHLPTLSTMKRAACEVVHSQKRREFGSNVVISGGAMWMIECVLPDDSSAAEVLAVVKETSAAWMKSNAALMSCSLLKKNTQATAPGSSSQSYLNANLETKTDAAGIRCIILLECSGNAQAQSSRDLEATQRALSAVPLHPRLEVSLSRIYSFVAGVSW